MLARRCRDRARFGPRPRSRCCHAEPDSKSVRAACRAASATARKPPLLFVHGGYCDALVLGAAFSAVVRGARLRRARAVACAATARSGGRETLFVAGLDDYAAESSTSMRGTAGAAGADRPFDGRGGCRADARDAPGARRGAARAGAAGGPRCRWPRGCRRAARLPGADAALRPRRTVRATCSRRCGRFYFSDDVAPAILREAALHLSVESPRAIVRPVACRHASAFGRRAARAPAGPGRDRRPHLPPERRATATARRLRWRPSAIVDRARAHDDARSARWERRARSRCCDWLETRRRPREQDIAAADRLSAAALRLIRLEIRRPAAACSTRNPGSSGSRARRGSRAARACPRLRRRPRPRPRASADDRFGDRRVARDRSRGRR